jgi:hypothetical protein
MGIEMSHSERTTGRAGLTLMTALLIVMPTGLSAQQPQQPAPPAGPMANEKYKNIQALTNVPADQLDVTMRYVAAAVNMRCTDCHVQEASGEMSYEKDDKRAKQTARSMMKMVNGINAANYGIRVECATCHSGHNQPVGLPMAEMLTPEQVAQVTPPPPPPGGGPQGAFGGSGGGRGQRPAGPPVGDVIDKYIAAIGGRPAVGNLQSLSMTGTVTNRAGQSSAFTIEEKPNKYRETRQTHPDADVRGFDGTSGWKQMGTKTMDLSGFPLDQALRLNDVGGALHLTEKYPTLQAGGGRPVSIDGKATTIVTGRAGIVTDQFYFDSASGLLLRRIISTRTPLGQLREQFDYADYRSAGDIKLPFEIKLTTWNALDTFKIADAKVNTPVDDSRFGKPR